MGRWLTRQHHTVAPVGVTFVVIRATTTSTVNIASNASTTTFYFKSGR